MNCERICSSIQNLPDDMIAEAILVERKPAPIWKWVLPIAACLVLLLGFWVYLPLETLPLPEATELPGVTLPNESPQETDPPSILLTEEDVQQSAFSRWIPDTSDLGFSFAMAYVIENLDYYQIQYHAPEGERDFFVMWSVHVNSYQPWWVDLRNTPSTTAPLYATPVFLAEQFSDDCIEYVQKRQKINGSYTWQFEIKTNEGFICYSFDAMTEREGNELFVRIVDLWKKERSK